MSKPKQPNQADITPTQDKTSEKNFAKQGQQGNTNINTTAPGAYQQDR